MFPSSQTGSGINSSFGLVPISGHSSSGSAEGTRNLAFNWLGHLPGRGGAGLFDEQTSGLKPSSDQIMDRSFMSIDRHTPSVPRRTPHSSVGGSSGQLGADAAQPPHPIPDPSMVNAFHPYRLVSDSLSAAGHSSLSTSQFAAFDSLYKAYHLNSTAPGSVFGTQPFRFDNPLLADQRLMLQASLLQYPHLGIFPNAAVYPGLSGAGVRYPSDYYGQNLSGMSLSSKYPDVGGPTWLGLDRSMSLLDREQDAKDSDRKNDLDISKRQNKDEHHRSRPEREEMLLRREPKEDGRRCEDGRRDSVKHPGEKKDQQKRSNSLKSPIRPEGLQPSMQDGSYNRCNSGGPSDFSYNSGRGGHAVPTYGLSADLSSLAKVSSSPGSVTSQQRQATSRTDRTIDSVQDHVRSKDRHHHHHHHHHHGWKPEETKSKATPLVLTVPKTSASVSTNGQQSKPFEKKFHRPFEQTQMNSVPSEKSDRLPGHGPRDAGTKNSRSAGSSLDYIARSADAKAVDSYRLLHQQQYRGLGGSGGKQSEPKSQLHSTSARKQGGSGGGGGLRYEEVPLNLVVTKGQNSSCGTVSTNPVNVGPISDDEYKFSRSHRTAAQPSLPPPVPSSEAGLLGPAWGFVSSDDVRLMSAKSADGLLGSHLAQTAALPGKTLPPVSKLDLEAKRRAQMRKNESCNSEDEDDGDEEDEDLLDNSKDLARLLLISSGPPLKQPFTPAKSSFLAMFGLVSSDASKEAAFERRQKRRELFREQSTSPIQIEEGSEPERIDKKPSFRSEIAHLDKHSFLGLLNLESARPHAKKRKVACHSDDMGECYREPLSSLSVHSDVVNPLPIQSSSGHDAVVDEFSISSLSRLDQKQRTEFCRPRGENCFRDSGFDILSESKPFLSSSGLPFAGGTVGPKWPNVTDGDYQSCNTKYGDIKSRTDGQSSIVRTQEDHRQLSAGFSLLNSATDGRFKKEIPLDSSPFNVNIRNASTPSSAAREATNGQAPTTTDLQCREPTFHWPGLEAVIESYHHYVEEQTMEKQLLREQSQRLRHHNAQLMYTAEHLRTRVSELIHSKQQLIEERLKTQSLLDGLKDTMKQLI